ncbi:MAG: phosphatase PAP2 family protein [Bacteroidota bacterium]
MILSFEIDLLEWIQNHRMESLDGILTFFTLTTTILTFVFILMIGLFSRFKRSSLRKIVQVTLTVILAGAISFSLKYLVFRERPFHTYDKIEKLTLGGSPSFPSGHAVSAFAVATSIALVFRRRRIQIPILIWACIVGYSRLALGVHYPSDVVGGILIGIITALGVDYAFRKWFNPP